MERITVPITITLDGKVVFVPKSPEYFSIDNTGSGIRCRMRGEFMYNENPPKPFVPAMPYETGEFSPLTQDPRGILYPIYKDLRSQREKGDQNL